MTLRNAATVRNNIARNRGIGQRRHGPFGLGVPHVRQLTGKWLTVVIAPHHQGFPPVRTCRLRRWIVRCSLVSGSRDQNNGTSGGNQEAREISGQGGEAVRRFKRRSRSVADGVPNDAADPAVRGKGRSALW